MPIFMFFILYEAPRVVCKRSKEVKLLSILISSSREMCNPLAIFLSAEIEKEPFSSESRSMSVWAFETQNGKRANAIKIIFFKVIIGLV